ncbi:zincin-like metallopeptidase domain-containing protein [Brevibacillus halotolerans]|uniref:ArdC family protein n=1 Tax=Brevibacillus TaxID=55080 RepID=UPI00215C5CF6|nr:MULTISPECIES: zincin-like metallopeptidase domain-containing protein [Brevibacillus]MCR8966138.1 zincin-like metallopeptidase domain-containing protein [Brevibacillus laterosporus]MCZ0838295.1 zincin-like metallopeptidase domain-containing protein [Brevibacillus halotolerans]
MSKVYGIITNKIIKLLEEGVVPWRKPWNSIGLAVNWVTQKPYRGINTMLLEPGEYATKKQIKNAGGKIKEKEKGHMIVFWTWLDVNDDEESNADLDSETTKKIPYIRYYKVYEINTQCEGLLSKRKDKEVYDHNPIEEAEAIIKGYKNAPTIKFGHNRASYSPLFDLIRIPSMCDFKSVEEFYSTLFHECLHSTGRRTRLNRSGVIGKIIYGSEIYSREELIAELGAAMLCGVCGIDNSTIENSASYISSWLRKLEDDPKLIIQAAAQAQKGVDLILDVQYDI